MDRHDVLYELKRHYMRTGKIMDPFTFESHFKGCITRLESIEGLMLFNQFLDNQEGRERVG